MASQQHLMDMHEPLLPALQAVVVEMPTGLTMIKHPYVNQVYMPGREKLANQQYKYKVQAVARAEKEGEWHTYVYLHERPWRFDALVEIMDRMSDTQFWAMVSDVWQDSENIPENVIAWDALLRTDRPGREAMMDDDELAALAALPEVITIYQGHTDERDDGWSWTTDRKVAEWFARKFAVVEESEPWLTVATVNRTEVLAYLLGRRESEILVNPDDVEYQKTLPVTPLPQPQPQPLNT
jgi:hypothetical protein